MRSRLDRLEARLIEDPASAAEAEVHEQRRWLAQARVRRIEAMPPDVRHARDLIGLFRTQGILSEMGAQELVEGVVSWRPEPEGERSRNTVEREVALAVYEREPGTENMACPSAWRESFPAGDELRERYSLGRDEVLTGVLEAAKAHAEATRGGVPLLASSRSCALCSSRTRYTLGTGHLTPSRKTGEKLGWEKWRYKDDDEEIVPEQGSTFVGWVDEDHVYLDKDATYAAVR